MKVLVILWGPFGHRADELSEAVGGERLNLTLLYGPRYFAPLRYLALFFRTLAVLMSKRPDVVYAQNPPVFCPLTSMLYCKLAGKKLVVDHHSIWNIKTVGGPAGKVIGALERVVARGAFANTSPHSVWARELQRMGASNVVVVHDFVERSDVRRDEGLRRLYARDGVLAIASHGGHPLERLESEIAAAGMVSGLSLVVTGPPEKLKARVEATKAPANVRFLGLLPKEEYLRLKASCDFALNITDEPHTLSHVIFEYLACDLPVITSRQEVVQDLFGDAPIYVESSSPSDVSAKLSEVVRNRSVLSECGARERERYARIESMHREEVARLRSIVLGSHA